MEQASKYNHQFSSSQMNLDLPKDGFDELEDLVKSLEIDIPKEYKNVNDLDFLTLFENEEEEKRFQKNISNCPTKSTKSTITENTLGKSLDLNDDSITSLHVASNSSSNHNINSIILKQLKTKDDSLTAIKTINERNNRMKILTLNASENVHRPPREFFEDKRSTETASQDYVSSEFVPDIFSEDMNDGPLILIPLTVLKALCSTHDSCSPDQNRYQGVQHDKITKKPIRKHGFDERMNIIKSIQIDNFAVNKRNISVENHQAFPIQKKSMKRLSQKRSTKELNKSSSRLVAKKLRNQDKKHSSSKCRICGEDATNYNHYGGKSCFSCRIFFKRAVEQSER